MCAGTDFGLNPLVLIDGAPLNESLYVRPFDTLKHEWLTFLVPPNEGRNHVVQVLVAGQITSAVLNDSFVLNYAPPNISRVTPEVLSGSTEVRATMAGVHTFCTPIAGGHC